MSQSPEWQRDDELCKKYARFASHLDRSRFTAIYWTMFMANLMVLFVASWTYTRAQEALDEKVQTVKQRRRQLKKYIFFCLGYVMLSMVIVTMEAFALLALEFCDGEDLMSLYWSTFTMIQVGSLIAIAGIILALAHSLRDNKRHPPWALALGTPVLVIAGVLHLAHDFTSRWFKKKRRSSKSMKESKEGGPPMSQVNTIQAQDGDDDTIQGEFIGFTIEGGPIVRFNSPHNELPKHSELLGYCDNNRPIVAYRKDSIRFINDVEKQEGVAESSRREDITRADPVESV